ncbi:hypothetical protein CPB86DRAFT_791925, partial [Serendipita vermifera]
MSLLPLTRLLPSLSPDHSHLPIQLLSPSFISSSYHTVRSLLPSLSHSLLHSLACSLSHPLIPSFGLSIFRSLPPPLILSFHSLTVLSALSFPLSSLLRSLACSVTRSLPPPLTLSFHSLTVLSALSFPLSIIRSLVCSLPFFSLLSLSIFVLPLPVHSLFYPSPPI